MLELILTVVVILWLADRASVRRRLEGLEQQLQELKRAAPGEPTPASAKPPPSAPATAAAPEWIAPGPEPVARPVESVRAPSGPALPLRSSSARIWELVSGGNPIVRFGVIILFFGVAFLLRYAAEHSHLTIEDRLIGVALGALALLALGWFWRNSRRTYAMALMGGGVGVLYLTVFIAYRNYALLNSMAFSVLGTVGGFLAPVLAATSRADQVGLFSYYAVLDLMVAGIAWFR